MYQILNKKTRNFLENGRWIWTLVSVEKWLSLSENKRRVFKWPNEKNFKVAGKITKKKKKMAGWKGVAFSQYRTFENVQN